MDKSVMVVDESRWRVDSVASVVGINLTPIDLDFSMEEIESPAAHEHFSIRGFVSSMRKQDPKVCLPFPLEGDDLPPLHVPRFRWWKCSNCILEVGATHKLMLLTSKTDHGLGKDSDIGGDDPEINVSSESECNERNQASCSHIGIPDLNEPFIETSSPTQRDDFEFRSSALLRFSDACEVIARESQRQMGADEEVPNNIERHHKHKGKTVIDMNTRSARDVSSASEGTSKSATSLNAYTQGHVPPQRRHIHLGGQSKQASRGHVASEVCVLNQNPADFSYPSATNVFTISANDLRPFFESNDLRPRKRKYRKTK